MEQQGEAGAAGPQAADAGHEFGLVPLVHDDEVGTVEQGGEVGAGGKRGGAQFPIMRAIGIEAGRAVIGLEIREAPRAERLERAHVVAERLQLAQHAAQKVRVSVVPARQQRVGEVADLQAGTTPSSA